MRERLRPSSVLGPVDRRALARLASSCWSEIILCTSFLWRLRCSMADGEWWVAAGRRRTYSRHQDAAAIGDTIFLDLFSNNVNGIGCQRRAQPDNLGVVHEKRAEGDSANRAEGLNLRPAPAEVMIPLIQTRMEEPGQHSCLRIDSSDVGSFIAIAVDTRKGTGLTRRYSSGARKACLALDCITASRLLT